MGNSACEMWWWEPKSTHNFIVFQLTCGREVTDIRVNFLKTANNKTCTSMFEIKIKYHKNSPEMAEFTSIRWLLMFVIYVGHIISNDKHQYELHFTLLHFDNSSQIFHFVLCSKMKRGQDIRLSICSYVAEKPCGCLYKLTCCNAKFHLLFKCKLYL